MRDAYFQNGGRWVRRTSEGRTASDAGFTLIEVIVALGILAFVLLAIAQLFSVALGLQNTSGRQTLMLSFGQQQLERLMSLSIGATVPPQLMSNSLPAACRARMPDIACWNGVDDNHRWPLGSNADQMGFCNCFIVWEVTHAQTPGGTCVAGQPCIIRMYVVPYPPVVTLRTQVLIGYVQ